VYLQEVGEKVPSPAPITALAVLNDQVFAIGNGIIHTLNGNALAAAPGAPAAATRMQVLDGALWVATESGAYRYADNAWTKVDDRAFVDFCLHQGKVHAATRDEVFRFNNGAFESATPKGGYLTSDSTNVMDDFSQVLPNPVRIGPIQQIASYSGTLYILQPNRLALIDVDTFVPDPIDWGVLPSSNVRDMLADGSRLEIATDRGVATLRGMALSTIDAADRLPYDKTTCLAAGFDNDLWIGTDRGAIRKVGDEFHYFGATLWLPGDGVNDIAVSGKTVYIATNAGLGIIRYEPYTLAKKAAYLERLLDEYGHKRLGFIHSLYWSDKHNEFIREISDNDGGHTSPYLSAMTFKYAATGDEQAREQALDSFKAMIWLDDITPKDGFIARAIWSSKGDKDEMSTQGSGGLPAKWYPTDDGLWYWKGDTSSDEVNAHYYSVALFHDLAAKGAEKDRAAQHIAKMTTHIMDNGWVLRDMDGKATRWGRWDPAYLLTPYGSEARGLNGMEAQTYVHTAYAMTGDEKYMKGLEQLIEWRYHKYTVRQKSTFPPDTVVPWDDELSFRCYIPLLTYTKDPDLRSIYLRSIERSYEVKRMEHLPFYNFAYGALTGNDCDEERAVKFLREFPLDTVTHTFTNSFRDDLGLEPGYEAPWSKGMRAMSPREIGSYADDSTAFIYDRSGNGKGIRPPVSWLEAYWMARYHGLIEAPKTTDPALTTVEPGTAEHIGAAPYDGPPRPEIAM
jgi:hypothetical protein